MSFNRFKEINAVFEMPTRGEPGSDPFHPVRFWLEACTQRWQHAYSPGTVLVVDESMLFWTGLGAHLTYLPRKPTPLGIMFKSLCDASTICFNLELVEGAERDQQKEFVREFKATTACTLRLTKPWWGRGRIVVADSWFGSMRTCEELAEVGVFSILCVKNGSAGYPKAEMKAAMQQRGDQKFMEVEVQMNQPGKTLWFYAGAHMDKKPLLLVASTGTSLAGAPRQRFRSKLIDGAS
jgi:hypothetical protein